jgi:hypothetical protein
MIYPDVMLRMIRTIDLQPLLRIVVISACAVLCMRCYHKPGL